MTGRPRLAEPDPGTTYDQLCSLLTLGPRFHGSSGEIAAAEYLVGQLALFGAEPVLQPVRTIGWTPGDSQLRIVAPLQRPIECWPMLWSAGAPGLVSGSVLPLGRQGLWNNAMVWQKFAVVTGDQPVAYLSARDSGPAAPQPVPAGSAESVPHLAIGQSDGQLLSNYLDRGQDVDVELSLRTERSAHATGNNLILDVPGRDADAEPVIVCGHYDTFWSTPGAYDNGSGTVTLLELAQRWLQRPPRPPVRLIFFAAEEWHLAGSRAYVATLSDQDRAGVGFLVNIDGLGRGDFLEYSVGPERFEYEVTRQIREYAQATGRSTLRFSARFPPLVGTDDAPFYAAGIPTVHLTFNDFDLLHRPEDLPKRDSAANIAWSIPLVESLVDKLQPADRAPGFDLL